MISIFLIYFSISVLIKMDSELKYLFLLIDLSITRVSFSKCCNWKIKHHESSKEILQNYFIFLYIEAVLLKNMLCLILLPKTTTIAPFIMNDHSTSRNTIHGEFPMLTLASIMTYNIMFKMWFSIPYIPSLILTKNCSS